MINQPPSESLIFGIVATLLTIITIIQTFRANKFAKKSAVAQRVFQKPNLQIEVYGSSDIEDFIIALPLGDQKLIEMPLKYTLLNSGKVSAKEIEIYVRMSKDLRYGGHGELVVQGGSEKDMKVAVASETENLKTIVTTLKSLHPDQSLPISDVITITSSTIIKESVSIETADRKGSLEYKLEFVYAIDILISQADQPPITKRISLSIIDTSERPAKDYFDEYNQESSKEYQSELAKLSLVSRLKQGWNRADKIKKIKLLIIDQSSYQENEIFPAVFTLKVGSMKMCEGVKHAQGYFIPAINVLGRVTEL